MAASKTSGSGKKPQQFSEVFGLCMLLVSLLTSAWPMHICKVKLFRTFCQKTCNLQQANMTHMADSVHVIVLTRSCVARSMYTDD